MSFGLYTLGTLILIAGVAYICHIVDISPGWAISVVVILLGTGIMGGVSDTRHRNPS